MGMKDMTQGPGTITTECYVRHIPSSGDPWNDTYVDKSTYVNFLHTIGVTTPEFHLKRKRNELLPMTYFKQYDSYGQVSSGKMEVTNPTGGQTLNLPIWRHNKAWTVEEEELSAELAELDAEGYVQAAAAKIYSNGWDALTFLAELKQTVRMFRNLTRRVADIIKEGKWENHWLEARYGWRTLRYDMEDLRKALAQLEGKGKRYSERLGSDYETTEVSTVSQVSANWSYDVVTTTQWEYGVRGTVAADINPPTIAFNPVTTAWEVTKLSFVVDWLVNVGQSLEALSFLALASKYTAAAGYSVRAVRTTEIQNVSWASGYSGSIEQNTSCASKLVIRVPTTVSKLPRIELNLDWLKVADLLALLRQALTR